MSDSYLAFILAYDYGYIFERMELACDEAYELAMEIVERFKEYCIETGCDCYYDTFSLYASGLSFEAIWKNMKGD